MVNDLTTVSGAAQEVIDHLEQHLYDKGVLDARFNPATGILGLVDRIPDIEPSVNINLTIDLSLSSSHSSIHYGESVVLTATLLASYEGVSEVDLQTGEITGATIIFKNGSTIIGTGTTDSNGVATLTYTPTVSETTLSINAVFDGTDNFNSASSRNVSIEVNDYLDLTSDKSILSYADNDNCIFTATYYGVTATGRSINLYNAKDDSLIGVMNDNNDGTYSYTYQSRGVGDLEVYAKDLGSFVSKTYSIEDCLYWNDGTKDDLTYPNGDFGSVVSEGLQLKGTTNSYQRAVIPTSLFSTNDNVSCEIKLGTYTSITPQLAMYDANYTGQGSVTGNNTNNEIASELSTSSRTVRNSAPVVNEIWKITRENGQSKFYIDDVLLDTVTRSINNFRFGFYTYNNRTEVIKYIKIKPL